MTSENPRHIPVHSLKSILEHTLELITKQEWEVSIDHIVSDMEPSPNYKEGKALDLKIKCRPYAKDFEFDWKIITVNKGDLTPGYNPEVSE